mmetsp:Transcript_39552/g.51816  ORF Transcript_39552/g.51816 Transcript_39552/m.51816 type:complete len:103 (-) Transcript_39552:934-1242(-)
MENFPFITRGVWCAHLKMQTRVGRHARILSVKNVDIVGLHAEGHEAFVWCLGQVLDLGEFLVADQVLKDRLLLVEAVLVHARLRCDQIGDGLRVLAGQDRVV